MHNAASPIERPDGALALCRRLPALAALGALALVGCTQTSGITDTGSVDDTTWTVSAPILLAVAPDPDAGFTPTQTSPGGPSSQPTPVVAIRVAEAVTVGTRVTLGDAVARMESDQQQAALRAAQAGSELVARRIDLLEANIQDIADKRSEATDKRAEVVDAVDLLTSKRAEALDKRHELLAKQADLDAQLKVLKTKRAEVAGQVAELDSKLSTLRATVADLEARQQQLQQALEATPEDPQLQAQLAQVTAALEQARAGVAQLDETSVKARDGLAQLDAGLTQARQGATKLADGLAQLTDGLKQLDDNLTKARDGLAQLDDALSQLDDAAKSLTDAHDLALKQVRPAELAVERARSQANLTVVTAPGDGVVVAAPRAGDVVRPGAPLVTIRPDASATVTTWLPMDVASLVCVGSGVQVGTDWGRTYPARVSVVGTAAELPPTSQATSEIHLIRAVRIAVTITSTDGPPPGAPVDLEFAGCKEN